MNFSRAVEVNMQQTPIERFKRWVSGEPSPRLTSKLDELERRIAADVARESDENEEFVRLRHFGRRSH